MSQATKKTIDRCFLCSILNHVLCGGVLFSDRISKESSKVFEDVLESFYSIDCIKSQFEAWRSRYYTSYKDAYIGLCLPKLFNPLIRLQLLTWTPLEVGGSVTA